MERSYLQAVDRPISISEFEQALSQSKIKLLLLSACQTAAGNDKSILGLAGAALRSEIPNVIGSLWSISDGKTADSINSFYTYFQARIQLF